MNRQLTLQEAREHGYVSNVNNYTIVLVLDTPGASFKQSCIPGDKHYNKAAWQGVTHGISYLEYRGDTANAVEMVKECGFRILSIVEFKGKLVCAESARMDYETKVYVGDCN